MHNHHQSPSIITSIRHRYVRGQRICLLAIESVFSSLTAATATPPHTVASYTPPPIAVIGVVTVFVQRSHQSSSSRRIAIKHHRPLSPSSSSVQLHHQRRPRQQAERYILFLVVFFSSLLIMGRIWFLGCVGYCHCVFGCWFRCWLFVHLVIDDDMLIICLFICYLLRVNWDFIMCLPV